MKRRLTIAILGTIVATLVLAGIGTLVLARLGARRASEDDARRLAESTADLVALGQQRFAEQSPAEIERAVCTTNRPAIALAEDLRAARDAFCANPSATTLDALRASACSAPATTTPSTPATRRVQQARATVCTVVQRRGEQRQQLERTLAQQAIQLVSIDPDGTVSPEPSLPRPLDAAALSADRLRAGETLSGATVNRVWAAAPVIGSGDPLLVVVLERPADPTTGTVGWFLLASGITLAIGAVVATWLGRRLTRPLREATAVTTRIADGDLAVRLPEHRTGATGNRDELESLAHSINAMAEALERSQGLERQFLLSVSHDLRTPLTSIRGYAEAIADGTTGDPAAAAGVILAESRRLERLVADLLDLAKLEARRFTFEIEPVDLAEVARDAASGFGREMADHDLRLEVEAPDTPVPAFADPLRLQQVIANLVENAIKFARSTVVVRVTADPPRLEVADDGPGIAEADLPHVFERLYVASAAPARKEVGSGLGLAIVRELVEAMGGRVWARAAPEGGAGLVVTLATSPATRASESTPPTG